ncbi:Rhs element Vgr protein [Dickeya chrysanthemi Ech1591]|uniref:Rhs element Vgr protein n=1 Tax=Dickeya chrysanthemi (strain Ech1591) TaxID=561229 RepID=C6CK41_DICC1|nr:type VI secretion system tip protein VgrG [Dickeya chrysanthemi]ACT05557.1 Rhs element Vgr protein [Dickeya chrysanthemi Ech1591]WJM84546.1 type VI secretion system tip protein VgrG [Dickeya chrysanthemi]
MADSPATRSNGVVTCTIKSNGTEIGNAIQVLSIHICKQVNHIARAELTIQDGDMPQNRFSLSSGELFKPGNTLTIAAGYASQEQVLFEGIIIRHGISLGGDGHSRLRIECRDNAIGMTVARRNNNYLRQKDSDILSRLIRACAGLRARVDTTQTQHDELVQFNCTDWDFLLTRAEANGLVVCNDDGTVAVTAPPLSASPVLTLTYGDDLMSLTADIDARHQFSAVTGVGWDIKNQQPLQEKAAAQSVNRQGNLSADQLAGVLGLTEFRLQSATPLPATALRAWASGQHVKSALSRLRGTLTCQGCARARINTLIELAGVGARFNGHLYVGGVRHHIQDGQWLTYIDFGMPPVWSAEHRDLTPPPAAGLLPGVDGLQIGIVKKLDGDPQQQHRVQVSVPVMQAENDGVWARLASYYASAGIGAQFMPEVGDEVILGYFNNNPSDPVILGSLYSSKNPPPVTPEAKNTLKTLMTRSRLTLQFNEEDKAITLTTPGGNQVVLSDKDKTVTLQDQNGNRVMLDSSGITLDSPKNITLSARGNIELSAGRTVELSAKADVTAAGMNVSLSAKTGLTAKGNATAELSASGQTVVKGGIVMIN